MKKVILIILVIIGFIVGLFIGTNEVRLNNEISGKVMEESFDNQYPVQALYGCPKSKKVKKPILKRKYIRLF